MSLSYNDLTLLRYIQKRQMIPLSKTALHFQKNESSIRRTIEQINLYSSEPMVRIEKSICYSCISYENPFGPGFLYPQPGPKGLS